MNPFSINFLLVFLLNLKFSRLNDVLPKCFVIGLALAGALLVLFGGACMFGLVLGFLDGPGFVLVLVGSILVLRVPTSPVVVYGSCWALALRVKLTPGLKILFIMGVPSESSDGAPFTFIILGSVL